MRCSPMPGADLVARFSISPVEGIRRVIDTNITGTDYLIHRVGNDMRSRNQGRILITGSIAGFIPGSFQAVYNGSKAFLNSFSFALREELRDTKVTVTCLMPGATETEFFKRADMLDTSVGTAKKDDAAQVAADRLQSHDEWRRRRRDRPEEQDYSRRWPISRLQRCWPNGIARWPNRALRSRKRSSTWVSPKPALVEAVVDTEEKPTKPNELKA